MSDNESNSRTAASKPERSNPSNAEQGGKKDKKAPSNQAKAPVPKGQPVPSKPSRTKQRSDQAAKKEGQAPRHQSPESTDKSKSHHPPEPKSGRVKDPKPPKKDGGPKAGKKGDAPPKAPKDVPTASSSSAAAGEPDGPPVAAPKARPPRVDALHKQLTPAKGGIYFRDVRTYRESTVAHLHNHGFTVGQPKSSTLNTHDRSAAFRAALEAQAVAGITKETIWDIGGHTTRHDLNQRANVHCTQPQLTQADVKRGHCIHTAMSCNCVDVEDLGLILAVHSAYYLSEDEMWRLCEIAGDAERPFKSIEHPYSLKSMQGTMDDGTYRYHYRGTDLFVTHECDETYTHKLPTWFLREKVVSVRGDRAIYRSVLSYLGDTNLVSYHVGAYLDPGPDPYEIAAHRTYDYANVIPGVYSVKYETDAKYPIDDVRGGFIAVHEQSDPWWDFWMKHVIWHVPVLAALRDRAIAAGYIRLQPPQLLPVPVSSALVHTLSTQITAESTVETIDHQARSIVRANPGLVQTGADGIAGLSRLYASHKAYFSYRNGITSLSNWTIWRSGAVTRVGLMVFGELVLFLLACAMMYRFKVFHVSYKRFFPTSVLIFLALRTLLNIPGPFVRRGNQTPPRTEPDIRTASECAKSIPELVAAKRKECEIMCTPDLSEKQQRFRQVCPPPASLTVQVFSTSSNNLHCAVLGRVMRTRPQPEAELWASAMEWVDTHIPEEVRPGLIERHPLPDTEAWIESRKLPSQRRLYRKAYYVLQGVEKCIENIRNWAVRKIFVKREKTFVAGKLPRVIIGSMPELQVYFGPFFAAFDERIKEAFEQVGIFYCVGDTAEKLSENLTSAVVRARAYRDGDENALNGRSIFVLGDDQLVILGDGNGGVIYVENDMGAFDTTHHQYSLDLRLKTYGALGMSEKDIHLWAEANGPKIQMTPVVGSGKYSVDFNMCSGNPDTCSGNSVINAVTCATAISQLRDVLVGPTEQAVATLQDCYTRFGFIPKSVVSRDQHAVSFLSGIVLDSADGRQVWIPKVFRMIVKLCYTVDPTLDPNLLKMGIRRSFDWCLFVPVFGEFLKAMPVWKDDTELREVDQLVSRDRSRWFKPGGGGPAKSHDVLKSFCAHYGLSESQVHTLGEYVRGLVSGQVPNDPVQDQLFRTCFHKDVPEYSE